MKKTTKDNKASAGDKRVAPQNQDGVPFELTFHKYEGILIEAELRSPLLDPILHPGGMAQVLITETDLEFGRRNAPRFVLDSFEIESLTRYLRLQEYVRHTLEAELPGYRARWYEQDSPAPAAPPAGVWEEAKVRRLQLRRRDTPSALLMATLKKELTPREFKAELAARDQLDTRSFFAVELDCCWEEEHAVIAGFRDGKFIDIHNE